MGGTYTLTVWGYGDSTGTYEIVITDATPDEGEITIGVDQPGSIDAAGERDIYTFTAPPNQIVYLDRIQSSFNGRR